MRSAFIWAKSSLWPKVHFCISNQCQNIGLEQVLQSGLNSLWPKVHFCSSAQMRVCNCAQMHFCNSAQMRACWVEVLVEGLGGGAGWRCWWRGPEGRGGGAELNISNQCQNIGLEQVLQSGLKQCAWRRPLAAAVNFAKTPFFQESRKRFNVYNV